MQKYSNEELVNLIRNCNSPDERKLYLGTLYEQNKGIIYKICKRYSGYEDINDLMQESYFGLCSAVDNYDSSSTNDFITYAVYWIKQKVHKYVRDCGSVVRIPSAMQERIFKYNDIIKYYLNEYGRKPSEREVCEDMGITMTQLARMKEAIVILSVASLDKLIQSEEDDTSLQDFIPDDRDQYEEVNNRIDADILSKVLWAEVDAMEPAEVNIIHRKYQDEKTAQEIGDEIGLSAVAVRTLEAKAIKRLRKSKDLKKYAKDYILYTKAYSGGLKSFRRSGYSVTEKIAMDNYENSNQEYLRRLEQRILDKKARTS